MTARNLAPPGNGAGAPREGAGGVEAAGGGYDAAILPHPADTTADRHIEHYLRGLIARSDDVPLIDQLTEADLGTPRATASIARAALAWYLGGRTEAIRARLLDDVETADLLARWRIRMAGHDVRGDTDWSRVYDVVQARREVVA